MANRNVFAGGEFLITDTEPKDIFIPEELSKEHHMILKASLDFVKKEIRPNTEQIEDKDEAFVKSLFSKAGELGLNGTDIPSDDRRHFFVK